VGTTTLTGADTCAAADLSGGAPRRPNERRSKKVLDLLVFFFCCVAPPIVDARTSTPPKNEVAAACLPTPATSASRGYHPHGVHIGPYYSRNTCILTTLRLRGGISTRRLLPSASAPVSSLVVLSLRLRGDIRVCVPTCIRRRAGTAIGLPTH
jgi:hypothetical protein